MTHPPRSEWDRFLKSKFRLSAGVALRFDSRTGYCLHDAGTTRSFALEDWQRQLLRGIEGEASFSEPVHEVLRTFSETVDRSAIQNMIRGLLHHRLIECERTARPTLDTAKSAGRCQPKLSVIERLHHWSRRWTLETAFGAVVIGGLLAFQGANLPALAAKVSVPEVSLSEMAWASDSGVPVRVWCRGVITEILVRDGDQVRSGDILARVADPMARETRDDLRRLLGECRVQRDRFYQQGDLVAYLRETKAMARLTGLLSEWEVDSGPVVLRAPVDGRIRQRLFSEEVGDAVRPGDVLMTIDTNGATPAAGDLIVAMP